MSYLGAEQGCPGGCSVWVSAPREQQLREIILLLQELKTKLSTLSHTQHPLFAADKDQALERSPGAGAAVSISRFHCGVLCSGPGRCCAALLCCCWSSAVGRPRAVGGLGCIVVPHHITTIFSAPTSAAWSYLSLFGLLFSVSCCHFPILAQHQVGSSCRCIFVSVVWRGPGGGEGGAGACGAAAAKGAQDCGVQSWVWGTSCSRAVWHRAGSSSPTSPRGMRRMQKWGDALALG